MKDEQFDKELSGLYQQRKSQIVAPNVNLGASSNIRKYSLFKLLSIFTVGGVASFGIMAIITHFAANPIKQKPMLIGQHQVDIADDKIKQVDDNVIVVKPKLLPKPEITTLESELDILTPIKNDAQVNQVEDINLNIVQIVELPRLNEPEFLIKPLYKVMPKFPNKSLQEQQSGAIRLRYEIDSTGSVKNIEVIKSDVSRPLQRSAKKALAKWKYKPEDNVQGSYEIIFEFNPIK